MTPLFQVGGWDIFLRDATLSPHDNFTNTSLKDYHIGSCRIIDRMMACYNYNQ